MDKMDSIQPQYEERITRAFRRALQLDVSQLPDHMSRASNARAATEMAATASPADGQREALVDELCSELYELLFKYVNLMDAMGGESLEEEQMINKVVLTLSRAGWTISLPDTGELGGQPSATKTPMAEAATTDRRPPAEGPSEFQWGRDSVPDPQTHGHVSGGRRETMKKAQRRMATVRRPSIEGGGRAESATVSEPSQVTDAARESHSEEDRWDDEGGANVSTANRTRVSSG